MQHPQTEGSLADDRPAHRRWTPGWIEAGAAVAAVVVAVIGLFVSVRQDDDGGAGATPTESATHYFVYGTTMPGHLRYPHVEDFVAEASPARVSGRLYDTGAGHPAAKFGGGQGTIEGFLLRLRPERKFEAERTFTEIESGLYQAVQLETDSGVSATAFEWIGPTDGMELIESGVWDREER